MISILLKSKIGIAITLALSSLILTSNANAQNFYKWVDKNGSTHYTLTPPPANAKKAGQVATYHDRVTYTAPPAKEEPQEPTKNVTIDNSKTSSTNTQTTESGQPQTD